MYVRIFIKNYVFKGPFQCPNCGGWNTWQVHKADGCDDCGYYEGYP